MPEDDDALDRVRRELYRLPPEQFLDARAAAAARDTGLAGPITTLRKPTVAAWIVNAHAAATPDLADELADLGARLAKAQADLETSTLRELTLERRRAVARATTAALDAAGRSDAGATIRDEVGATFDAAVADPDVAARLGALQRPERWSGFGAVSPAAALSVVPSRRAGPATTRATAPEPEPQDDPRLAEARTELQTAQGALDEATGAEGELTSTLRRLTTRLTTLQHQIADVREQLDQARDATTAATRTRRQAQSAVDRLERSSARAPGARHGRRGG